jgi:hypothetical protein
MIQYIIAAGIGAFLGSRSKKSKKSYAEGGGIGSRFELGTPVNYRTEDYSGNERIESGEVVLRNGKKAIKLYKDSNYSGDGERIRFFNEIDMSQVKNFSDSTYAEGGKITKLKKYKSIIEKHRAFNKLYEDTGQDYDYALEMWIPKYNELVDVYSEQEKDNLIESLSKLNSTYAHGGEVHSDMYNPEVHYQVVVNDDYDEPYYFKDFASAKKYTLANVKKQDNTIISPQGDTIEVEKNQSNKDLDWLFQYSMEKGGSTYAEGGELKIYVDKDDEPIKVVKGLNNAKKWVLKNKRYHEEIVVEDEALDTIVVDKTDTIKDIDWLFNPTYAKGGKTRKKRKK